MTVQFGSQVPSYRHAEIRAFVMNTVNKSSELYRIANSPRDSDFVMVIQDWDKSTTEPKDHLTAEVYYASLPPSIFTS